LPKGSNQEDEAALAVNPESENNKTQDIEEEEMESHEITELVTINDINITVEMNYARIDTKEAEDIDDSAGN